MTTPRTWNIVQQRDAPERMLMGHETPTAPGMVAFGPWVGRKHDEVRVVEVGPELAVLIADELRGYTVFPDDLARAVVARLTGEDNE